jgi:hypothetical protein
VDQLGRVQHAQRPPHLLADGRDLDRAAGVSGGDGVRARREQVLDLPPAELSGRLGIQQVVDTCGTTADFPLGGLDQLERGDLAEERARLRPDALRVGQVAGVVVGDLQRDRVSRRSRAVTT